LTATGSLPAFDVYRAYGLAEDIPVETLLNYDVLFVFSYGNPGPSGGFPTFAAEDWGDFFYRYVEEGGAMVIAANASVEERGFSGAFPLIGPLRSTSVTPQGVVIDVSQLNHPMLFRINRLICLDSGCHGYAQPRIAQGALPVAYW